MKKVIFSFIILMTGFNSFGQSKTQNNSFSDYLVQKNFNGTILVQKNDSIIYHNSFGLANRQFNVNNSNNTKYKVGSITKLFTSILILQLYESGKIDLNMPITTYLPFYKGEGGDIISIHQLLNHTSGIINGELVGKDVEIYRIPNPLDTIISKYCSGKLIWEPGTRWSYNNSEYIILGRIIEEIYKKTYRQVLHEKILQPLKMINTDLVVQSTVIENLASCYMWDKNADVFRNNPPFIIDNYYAAASMYSTSNDILTFSNALYGGKLLNPNSMRLLLHTSPLSENYGYGLWVYFLRIKDNVYKTAYRPGRIQGANTILSHFLNTNLTIIILANTDKVSIDELHGVIAEQLVE